MKNKALMDGFSCRELVVLEKKYKYICHEKANLIALWLQFHHLQNLQHIYKV